MNSVERFFAELERQGAIEQLPRDVRQALRDELAAHLDAAILARTEIGTPLEQAQSDAVEALGNPRALVQGVVEARGERVRPDRWLQAIPFALLLFYVPPMITYVPPMITAFPLWYLEILQFLPHLTIACIVWRTVSGRGRQVVPMLKSNFLAAAVAAICLSAYFMPTRSGTPLHVSRWAREAYVSRGLKIGAILQSPVLSSGDGTWQGITLVNARRGHVIPTRNWNSVSYGEIDLAYRSFPSRQAAEAAWEKFRRSPAEKWATDVAKSAQDAKDAPLFSVSQIGFFAVATGGWCGLLFLITVAFHLITALIRDAIRIRRSKASGPTTR